MSVTISCLWNLKLHLNVAIYSSPKVIVTDLEEKCHPIQMFSFSISIFHFFQIKAEVCSLPVNILEQSQQLM